MFSNFRDKFSDRSQRFLVHCVRGSKFFYGPYYQNNILRPYFEVVTLGSFIVPHNLYLLVTLRVNRFLRGFGVDP